MAKLADDLYIGSDTMEGLFNNWQRVLEILHKNNIGLAAKKTVIAPKSTNVLGWIWDQGQILASAHRISPLASCEPPRTVGSLRSFIGAYKFLSRVLPACATVLAPLDEATAGRTSQEEISWSTALTQAFFFAQKHLSHHRAITLPRSEDRLWIVADGSAKYPGMGATMYVTRESEKPRLAGFF